MKHLVLDMKTHTILSSHDTADEAHVAADAAPSPNHVLPSGDWSSLPTQDIKAFHNNLPGVKPVERFSDRGAALRRIVQALNGEAPKADPNTQETPMKAKRVKAKAQKKEPAPKAKPSLAVPRGKRSDIEDRAVKLAPGGKKDGLRFQEGSPRSLVFAEIKHRGEVTIAALEKKFPDMTRAQVLGCLTKLRTLKYIA